MHNNFNDINNSHVGNEYIGKNINEVKTALASAGVSCRVSSKDGQAFVLTRDYKPHRFNFGIDNDVIVSVRMG